MKNHSELKNTTTSPLMERINWVVFWSIHLLIFTVFWTGVSSRAAFIAAGLYWGRMFVITGGYHRYFSHKSYQTSRAFQFILALLGTTCVQKGVLWWAARHRHHHYYSDKPEDVHSPQRGFLQSHIWWVSSGQNSSTDRRWVQDWAKFPELVWLDKYHFVAPLLLAAICLSSAGWSGLVVGMGWSTVVFWHATFTVNSLAHVWGPRRFNTHDTSRNNAFLAFITMGEGWHNNHHHYMHSARQGFRWWEYDATFYVLWCLEKLGVIWDLKRPKPEMLRYTSPAPTFSPPPFRSF